MVRDVPLWKTAVAFALTFLGIYGFAVWRGPLGFYDSGLFSVPQYTLPSVGWALLVTLVVNALWWVVLLLPSGIRRPTVA